MTDYAFLSKDSLHAFCKICGVSVVVRVTNPKEDLMPINVRTIDGFDLDTLTFKYYDGRSNDPQYSVWEFELLWMADQVETWMTNIDSKQFDIRKLIYLEVTRMSNCVYRALVVDSSICCPLFRTRGIPRRAYHEACTTFQKHRFNISKGWNLLHFPITTQMGGNSSPCASWKRGNLIHQDFGNSIPSCRQPKPTLVGGPLCTSSIP